MDTTDAKTAAAVASDPFDGNSYYTFKRQVHTCIRRKNAEEWESNFSNFYRPIGPHSRRQLDKVKIAVLDSGVDISVNSAYSVCIKGKKTFISTSEDASSGYESDESDDPDEDVMDEDLGRHGTHIVELIHKLAPCAEIYVAKIRGKYASPLDPGTIAKAIKYAVQEWNVHIISMSLGFEKRYENIEIAIKDAAKRGKIMLAAASNLGGNGPQEHGVTFPAWMPEVICVNSGDGFGKYSAFNPEPRQGSFNFLTLGEAVLTSGHDSSHPSQAKSFQTGTSFATPIAAAMAALLIEFVFQKPLRKDISLRDEVVTQNGIIKLFAGMSESKVQNFRYLQPWQLIRCELKQDGHDCKECRAKSAERVKNLLNGPMPNPDGSLQLPDLPHAAEAELDSELNYGKDKCLDNTRVEILDSMEKWVSDAEAKPIWWLTGKTGTGKSTIAKTLALRLLEKQQLGATFFFSRNHENCRTGLKFVTSLAYQLAKYSAVLAKGMVAAIAKDGDLIKTEKARATQWQKLILEPLRYLKIQYSPNAIIVVMIDALDECEDVRDIKSILGLLNNLGDSKVKLRVIISSRPEQPIEEEFGDSKPLYNRFKHFDLGSIPRVVVDGDISTLIRHDLNKLRVRLQNQSLDTEYINEDIVQRLTDRSDGLFIYSKVACRYISGDDNPGQQSTTPKMRLDQVLSNAGFSDLNSLYAQIMKQAVTGDDSKCLARQLRQVLQILVAGFQPLSEHAFIKLCPDNMDPFIVKFRLNSLQSVLSNRGQPIQIYHESFRTFLLQSAAPELIIDEQMAHDTLFDTAFRLLSNSPVLKRDICDLGLPAVDIREIELGTLVNQRFPEETRYACLYWVEHLEKLSVSQRTLAGLRDDGRIYVFLRSHFLHWVEALSLLKSLPKGISMAIKLTRCAEQAIQDTATLLRFAQEAHRFIRSNFSIIEDAPLQLYASSLLFCPGKSVIRSLFEKELWPFISIGPRIEDDWNACIQTLGGHNEAITTLAFSPDRRYLASVDACTLRIWNPNTGNCIEVVRISSDNLGYLDQINLGGSVKFSCDSKSLLVSQMSHSSRCERWDTRTKEYEYQLDRCKIRRSILAFKFLPSGGMVSMVEGNSFDENCDMKIWYVTFGDCLKADSPKDWEKDIMSKTPIVFSSNGRWFFRKGAIYDSHGLLGFPSLSTDGKIPEAGMLALQISKQGEPSEASCLSFRTCRQLKFFPSEDPPEGVELFETDLGDVWVLKKCGRVWSCDFSPDGNLLATSMDDKVKIWNPATGENLWILEGHQGPVKTIAFAPDGSYLASAGDDMMIKLWDVGYLTTDTPSTKPPTHADITSLKYSAGGRWLVSRASHALNIWNPTTNTLSHTIRSCREYAFSPDGSIFVWESIDSFENLKYTTHVLETGKWNQLCEFGVCKHDAWFSISFDNRWLVSHRLWDPFIIVSDIMTGVVSWKLRGHEIGARVASFSPDNRWLSSVSVFLGKNEYTSVQLWDLETGACVWGHEGHPRDMNMATLYSPDGCWLASCLAVPHEGTLMLSVHETEDEKIGGESRRIRGAVFSPDGQWLFGLDSYGIQGHIWDMTQRKFRRHLNAPFHPSYAERKAIFSPNSQWLAWAGVPGQIQLLDMNDCTADCMLLETQQLVGCLIFTPDSRWLVLVGEPSEESCHIGTVQLWDPKTGTCKHILRDHPQVMHAAVSPNIQLLATAGGGFICLWDMENMELVHRFGDAEDITSIVFSVDSQYLISMNTEEIRFWSLAKATCERIQALEPRRLRKEQASVAFSPDGRWLAASDGTWTQLSDLDSAPNLQYDYNLDDLRTWIRRGEEEIVWIPPEYRPIMVATAESKVAISCPSGQLLMFEFNPESLYYTRRSTT